jgi:2'-5' RNA ligase
MPRLFTGIEIPDLLTERLAMLRGGLKGARWIDTDRYHLTLRFIGDIDDYTAGEISDALTRVTRSGFTIELDGLDSFGSRKPHSLVARVAPSRALAELQAEHERIIQRIGLPAEQRRFVPHVTLARLRGTTSHEAAEYLSLRGGFTSGPFPVDQFVLYSSRSMTGGGPYVVEQAYPLRSHREAMRATGTGPWQAL